MKTLRGSELQEFLRCRKRWDYRWNQKIVPLRPNGKLFFGTLFHKYLEEFYSRGQDAEIALERTHTFLDEQDTSSMDTMEYDELMDLFRGVTAHYHEQWDDWGWRVLGTEMNFIVPLTDELYYEFTIDMYVRDQDNRHFIIDTKTAASIEMFQANTKMDRQISRYWWAMQQVAEGKGYLKHPEREEWMPVVEGVFKKPDGFIYNIILKDVPKEPRVLKNGTLSLDKAQKTTYRKYVAAMEQNNIPLDEPHYQEILDHLKAGEAPEGNRFFRRIHVTRMQEELDAALEDFIETAKDMEGARIYRNVTYNCAWDCAYRDLCLAEMDGSDADFIRSMMFEKLEDEAYGDQAVETD